MVVPEVDGGMWTRRSERETNEVKDIFDTEERKSERLLAKGARRDPEI